ncbi:hypothetical protein F511_47480 [Dorcoceras hygrometricum]|nr:hypothetical protein F511_47480 [Dorcoceras hygrometricum]
MSTAELISNVEDDKNPAKERTQRTTSCRYLQSRFQTGRICVQRIEFKQRLIYEKNAIEEVAVGVDVGCTVHQQREDEPEAKLSTIILEKA